MITGDPTLDGLTPIKPSDSTVPWDRNNPWYWARLKGHSCSCGTWVPHGADHLCPRRYPTQGWSPVAAPQRFNGKLDSLADLPEGKVGDSYYIQIANLLVFRSNDGWVIVPKGKA